MRMHDYVIMRKSIFVCVVKAVIHVYFDMAIYFINMCENARYNDVFSRDINLGVYLSVYFLQIIDFVRI